jgi:uncharacterized protein
MPNRALIWSGRPEWEAGWRAEMATVELSGDGLRARGSQLGRDPVPYRLDYELDAIGDGFATRSLSVHASGEEWTRSLRLRRSDMGEWTIEAGGEGAPELPEAGGDPTQLVEALDCDLGFSPLTNAMPIRRHDLHRGPGKADFLMAWVSVPDLSIEALAQRYTHLRLDSDGAVVRYESVENGEVVFRSDLELDTDGLVRLYPKLALRVD